MAVLSAFPRGSGPRAPQKSTPTREKPATATARLSYKEKQELAGLPGAIADAEARLAALDAQLGDPALYAKAEAKQVTRSREEVAAEVAHLYARWEELEGRGGT